MGKQLKCPRCQSIIDITNLSPGTTVRCPDCGGMARIPTGQTGIRPRVPTPGPMPAAPAEAAPAREATRVRARRERTMVRRRGGHGGLIAGISIAAVAVVVVLLVLVMKSPAEPVPVKKKARPVPEVAVVAPVAGAAVPLAVPAAAPAAVPPAPPPSEDDLKKAQADDAKLADWNNIMSYLRSGGAFDDPERAEGIMFAKVKRMGKAAYPYLLKYVDHEELTMARAAVTVLDALTGRKSPFLTAANRDQIKKDWEDWIKANP